MRMDKKKNQHKSRLSQSSLLMRMLAGGYLLYIVYRMVKGLSESMGFTRIVSLVGIGVFLMLGILLLSHSIYVIKSGNYVKAGENEEVPERTEQEGDIE